MTCRPALTMTVSHHPDRRAAGASDVNNQQTANRGKVP
jgi:hypothetical protein